LTLPFIYFLSIRVISANTMPHNRRRASRRCTSAGRVTAQVLLSFLAISPPPGVIATPSIHVNAAAVLPPIPILPSNPEPPIPTEHTFTLRHIYHHGTYRHPRLHRKQDVFHSNDEQVFLAAEDGYDRYPIPPLKARSQPMKIERLVDRRPSVVEPLVAMSRRRGHVSMLGPSAWTVDDLPGPDVTHKDSVLSFALIASDAYVELEGMPDWEDIGAPFNRSDDFGWEGDGLRGHVWADDLNSTIIVGLKGTSMAVFDGDGTTTNDKENDNLFFSCCCAQQGQWSWRQVCNCATSTYSCNNTCVNEALNDEHRYYTAAKELYSNITELYPSANVWLVGHSLGGAISALLGLTYGVPAVTFEAVPDALAAMRLGLPSPPGSDPDAPQSRELTGAFHIGHTADPVYIGTCNGATATCSYAGYAMESACHTGRECVYDVVADKGWRVAIGTHKIRSVIHDVILKYDTVPECVLTPECRDCAKWKMYESNGTESTTTSLPSSTTTKTRTRTQTCSTPGWWGCLDETTTTATTTTTTDTTTTSTTTCETPGWFGCKDTSVTTTTSEEVPTITTTRETNVQPTGTTSTTTCLTPGRVWGCNDKTTATVTSTLPVTTTAQTITSAPTETPTSTPSKVPGSKPRCLRRSWFGWCKKWDGPTVLFEPDEI
jgi:lipase ATG15